MTSSSPPSKVLDYNNRSCIWSDLYPEEGQQKLLKDMSLLGSFNVLVVFCVFIWLTSKKDNYISKKKISPETFRLLMVFYYVMMVRACVATLVDLRNALEGGLWSSNFWNCELMGTLLNFIFVLELELLTHICIERYVIAKYMTYGWPMITYYTDSAFLLSTMLALLYSVVPRMVYTSYAFDFNCTDCVFDMILPNDGLKWIIALVLFLKSVKPVCFMIGSLLWARRMERNSDKDSKARDGIIFTEIVIKLTSATLCGWLPIFLVRATVVVSQLLIGEVNMMPRFFIDLGYRMFLLSPTMSALCLLYTALYVPTKQPVNFYDKNEVSGEEMKME